MSTACSTPIAHADHLHGIDELRAFWMKNKRLVDVYADDADIGRILDAFGILLPDAVRRHISADPQG